MKGWGPEGRSELEEHRMHRFVQKTLTKSLLHTYTVLGTGKPIMSKSRHGFCHPLERRQTLVSDHTGEKTITNEDNASQKNKILCSRTGLEGNVPKEDSCEEARSEDLLL